MEDSERWKGIRVVALANSLSLPTAFAVFSSRWENLKIQNGKILREWNLSFESELPGWQAGWLVGWLVGWLAGGLEVAVPFSFQCARFDSSTVEHGMETSIERIIRSYINPTSHHVSLIRAILKSDTFSYFMVHGCYLKVHKYILSMILYIINDFLLNL